MDSNAAKCFVKDQLEVNFVQDKSELLEKIVRAFLEKIPFQNISTGVVSPENRFPSREEVLDAGISLKGDLNVHNNGFAKILLEALDYKVHIVAARLLQPPSLDKRPMGSHFGVVVRDVAEPGDLRLIDVGCGQPIFRSVPLRELPYTATDVDLAYRFIEEDGQWHLEHGDTKNDTWTRFASYNRVPVKGKGMESFEGPVLRLLREDWLVGGIMATRYPQPGSTSIPDVPDFDETLDYLVRIETNRLAIRNSSGFAWEEAVLDDQMLSTLGTLFPSVPSKDVEERVRLLAEKSLPPSYPPRYDVEIEFRQDENGSLRKSPSTRRCSLDAGLGLETFSFWEYLVIFVLVFSLFSFLYRFVNFFFTIFVIFLLLFIFVDKGALSGGCLP